MKNLSKILILLIVIITTNCIKPIKIIIPDSMLNYPAMPVIGTQESWKLDFGGFHAYEIMDRDSRVLLTDARNTSYDIKSFEFKMTTSSGTQFNCYCEFNLHSHNKSNIKTASIFNV